MSYQINAYLMTAFIILAGSLIIIGILYLFKKLEKRWIYSSFFAFFLMIGLYFVGISVEPIPPSGEIYEFEVAVFQTTDTSEIVIYGFNLFYDFKKQEGEIQFYIGGKGTKNLQHLRIELPDNSIFTNVVLFNGSEEEDNKILNCVSKDENFSEEELCRITQMDDTLKINFEKQKNQFMIHAKFKGLMQPDGKFIFENGNRLKQSIEKEKGLFDFNLGDYECRDNCLFTSYDRIKLSPMYKINKPQIIINKESEKVIGSYKPIGREEFSLNAINNKFKFLSNLYITLSAAFFVAAFMLLVEAIISWNKKIKVQENVRGNMICNNCNHIWKKRTNNPRKCPSCNSKAIKGR